jgi:8-oxo-dGTP pyrophosphatase MutT (NUDIX family)
MREATLVFPIDARRVLLGLKKRGFGAGKWNGFGGKIEDESVREAAARELEEECGLRIEPASLICAGVLEFSLPEVELRVHLFRAERFIGEPEASEEMEPRWYRFDEIPYASMWEDDYHWLPYVLAGKTVSGRFVFNEEGIVSVDLTIGTQI